MKIDQNGIGEKPLTIRLTHCRFFITKSPYTRRPLFCATPSSLAQLPQCCSPTLPQEHVALASVSFARAHASSFDGVAALRKLHETRQYSAKQLMRSLSVVFPRSSFIASPAMRTAGRRMQQVVPEFSHEKNVCSMLSEPMPSSTCLYYVSRVCTLLTLPIY